LEFVQVLRRLFQTAHRFVSRLSQREHVRFLRRGLGVQFSQLLALSGKFSVAVVRNPDRQTAGNHKK
jgi:hypothetical protein